MFKPRLYLPSRVSSIADVYALDLRERKGRAIFANGFSLLLSAFSGSFLFILPGPNCLALTVLTFGFSSFKLLWASLNRLFCYRFSVASALHSDSHDRYERLTSVSSSVDYDQRDNVSGNKQKVLFFQLEPWSNIFPRFKRNSCDSESGNASNSSNENL